MQNITIVQIASKQYIEKAKGAHEGEKETKYAAKRHIPTRQVGVDPIHKRSIVSHFRRHGAEEMANPLLVLHIDLEVPNENYTSISTDALLAPAEFP